ncbi:hypothetical protein HMPREF0208_01413 [Citrobacter koseri]|nr:hypothetical protein HMPREF0208_01413 [Citrobacter koseri]
MFKLADNLPRLIHPHAAQPPVRAPFTAVKARNGAFPAKIQGQPLRAVNNILQNQIVNGSVGVSVLGANIKQIAARDAVRAIVEHMQTVAAPDQHQFTKLVCMFREHILRIAIGNRDSLAVIRKKVFFQKD